MTPESSPPPSPSNTSAGLSLLRAVNAERRTQPWPQPYHETRHVLRRADARDLSWVAPQSVHLIVTSPPYWTLKAYAPGNAAQLGDVQAYGAFLDALDDVWRGCVQALVPGGRLCIVVGDVCLPRKQAGRHHVMPLHADLQVRARTHGLDVLTPVLWHKIANGKTEAAGNGAGFYGKPYQPGGIIKNDLEYVLLLRKPGAYRQPSRLQQELSVLTKAEMQAWFRSIWTDLPGASTQRGHPAPFPVSLAERLIRMFSFAGDTVLDPFAGSGTTLHAAARAGRHSLGGEVEAQYVTLAAANLSRALAALGPLTPAARLHVE